jgi:hypothetical protein
MTKIHFLHKMNKLNCCVSASSPLPLAVPIQKSNHALLAGPLAWRFVSLSSFCEGENHPRAMVSTVLLREIRDVKSTKSRPTMIGWSFNWMYGSVVSNIPTPKKNPCHFSID